jgi:hypothetical protein
MVRRALHRNTTDQAHFGRIQGKTAPELHVFLEKRAVRPAASCAWVAIVPILTIFRFILAATVYAFSLYNVYARLFQPRGPELDFCSVFCPEYGRACRSRAPAVGSSVGMERSRASPRRSVADCAGSRRIAPDHAG